MRSGCQGKRAAGVAREDGRVYSSRDYLKRENLFYTDKWMRLRLGECWLLLPLARLKESHSGIGIAGKRRWGDGGPAWRIGRHLPARAQAEVFEERGLFPFHPSGIVC